ncbi:DsbA family oxidoreductase [Nocardia sp. alder85J]|uniref:DsbA family oxidoreductase n=1 Tax=Nocardia sp. alder85J TaxID=2862949 RepID=UPI001CD486B9|nr:DsbA family protein [Nocardia sp. alder85J]MCX4096677.1 DsbA family protein [Nocardia sp. alder85J]
MPTTVEVFVDYVCPYCFLVESTLEQLRRDRDVEIVIRPFELRPDPVPTLRPEDDYLPRVWHRSVYPMARGLGIDITLPTVSPQPRTEPAFVLLQLAAEHGVAAEYSTAVFRAFFQQNRDIGEAGVLLDIATSVGLDATEAVAALHDTERRERQRAAQRDAVESIGVTAVPSFRIGDDLLPGVLDADTLVRAVDRATGRSELPR